MSENLKHLILAIAKLAEGIASNDKLNLTIKTIALGHPKAATTETEIEVKNNEEIKVGDRVTITDCPGHWSWASPFTVKSINGNLVKLEMVSEPVEIERLFVIDG